MFIGEYSHKIDQKGRIAVPVKFRKNLRGGAVVTKGLDNSLFLYTQKQWEEIAEKLSRMPFNQKNTRAFSRLMLAGAMEVNLDRQGRIIIPKYLERFAGLKKKVVLTGLYNRVEIWDQTRWDVYKKKMEKDSDKIAEGLSEF